MFDRHQMTRQMLEKTWIERCDSNPEKLFIDDDADLGDISSSYLREMRPWLMDPTPIDMENLIHPCVEAYIRENLLYE